MTGSRHPDRRATADRFLPALAALPAAGQVIGCEASILRDALLDGLARLSGLTHRELYERLCRTAPRHDVVALAILDWLTLGDRRPGGAA